ncbi:MAG: radical SAM family heme chaperone HemW, partial [Lachnospiraceae bacterium]|nr:radical SAM family heme chaperone HemW [Lachnospiraceae bacterium]
MNTTDTRHDLSIYIHIPFCERKCLYCDFLSFSAQSGQIDEYVRALSKEIELYGAEFSGFTVRSIFFGGGTPSFPDEKLICGLLEKIFDCFVVDDRCEISIEVNPASAMKEKLIAYKKAGFNRLSIGAQSMSDTELKRLGRLHSSRQFLETFENARSAGFNNINVDLMSAIPEQDIDSYRETLMKVITLKPEHISAYSLIVEEGTPFCDMELELPSEEVDRKMYHETKKLLSEHGYFRYEI